MHAAVHFSEHLCDEHLSHLVGASFHLLLHISLDNNAFADRGCGNDWGDAGPTIAAPAVT